jgi:hypothetical protein
MDININLFHFVMSIIYIQLSFTLRFINPCVLVDCYCKKKEGYFVFLCFLDLLRYKVAKSIVLKNNII